MSHSRADSSVHAITRHYEYFLSGGDLFIMVENVQFRVHSHFFDRESPWFRTKMATPASPGMPKPGTSESTAIILTDLRPAEFSRFLWVFYNPKFSIYNAPVEDWSVILRLAHRWTFHEVKDLAVRELQKLDSPDIDRIVLYHDCQVDRNLLIPRYAAICEREEPLTLEEGMRLGLETTLMLARAREYARGRVLSSGERSPISATIARHEMVGLIRQLFGIPPSRAEESDVANTITVMAPTVTTNGNATTSSSQPPANGNPNNRKNAQNGANAAPVAGRPAPGPPVSTTSNGNATTSAPDGPPQPPSKNDTTTASENGANGSASQNGGLERTGSKASTNSAADASKDGGNDGDFKDKLQNGAASDANASHPTPDSINTALNTDLVDLSKEDLSGKQSPGPGGRKKGWLKSAIPGR
ncbi:hypothetical protein JOM56_002768 [Amanita muscaria]